MKQPQAGENWFFVDESGDPTFYDRHGNLIVGQPGCSPILLLGFIETQQPSAIRKRILELQREVLADPYLQQIPSVQHRTSRAFHAKDDAPEVRYLVYKLLAELDFKAQFVVARKIERVFRNRFQARPQRFYDHLIPHLFQNVLHRYQRNHIYFAKRGSRDRQQPLVAAIQHGVAQFEQRWDTEVATEISVTNQRPVGEPCLVVTDYMNWAVYRAFTRGEMRYFNGVADKVSLLVDLYDTAKYPRNWYHRRNPFDVKKISPL